MSEEYTAMMERRLEISRVPEKKQQALAFMPGPVFAVMRYFAVEESPS